MLEKIKSGHLSIFFVSLLASITNFLLPITLVRLLPPEAIGHYKVFFLYSQAIIFIIMAGGPLYSVYYWVGKQDKAKPYLQQSWLLSNLLGSLTIFIGIPLLYFFPHLINLPFQYTLLLLISAAVISPSSFYGELLIAKGKQLQGSLLNSSVEMSKALLFILVAWRYRSIEAIFWTYTILFILKNSITIFIGYRQEFFTFKINTKYMKEVIAYSFPIALAGTLGFFIDKVDMLLLSSRISPEEFAYYSMGCLVLPPLILFDMAVQKVLLPKLSTAYEQQNFLQAKQDFIKAQADISLVIIPAVVGLILFAGPTIHLLFTDKYDASIPFLKVYALGYLTYIFPHDAVPRASGRTTWILKIYLILTPITLGVVYFFAGKYGAMGALTSTIIFRFIPKFWGLAYSSHIMQWKLSTIFPYRHFIIFGGSSIVLAFLAQQFANIFTNELIWFAVTGTIMITCYSIIIKLMKSLKVL